MKHILTLLAIAFLTVNSFAQTNAEKAQALMNLAIEKMDAGLTKEAIGYLEQAKKLDPSNPSYDYEMAFAYNIDRDYKKVIKICEKLTKHPQQFARVYQMLGNAYDYDGNPKKAIKTYERGLKKFPNSGELYLERGNMEMMKEEYNNAIGFYVQGTLADPSFPSNYYWCAKIYLNTDNEYLGMIYGEIFMNLERNSKRTQEISAFIYRTYQNEITFSGDTSVQVSFASNTIYMSKDMSAESLISSLMPFGRSVYEMTLSLSVIGETEISLSSLNNIRTRFRESYYANDKHVEYPIALFEYQKTVQEAGYMEPYNYWILSEGDAEAFEVWYKGNETVWEEFIEWFGPNQIEMTQANRFVQP